MTSSEILELEFYIIYVKHHLIETIHFAHKEGQAQREQVHPSSVPHTGQLRLQMLISPSSGGCKSTSMCPHCWVLGKGPFPAL